MPASHVSIDPGELKVRDAYKLLIGSVLPRPIAWVSSVSATGVLNLAPFSFFTVVSCEPPMISVTVVPRDHLPESDPKDTAANIAHTRDFVVNVVSAELGGAMAISAEPHIPEVDEFAVTGLTPAESDLVAPPRVSEAAISMECALETLFQPGSDLVAVGRIVRMHFREGLVGPNGRVDVPALDPLGRLAGNYTVIDRIFDLPASAGAEAPEHGDAHIRAQPTV